MKNNVTHPSHYNSGKIEVIEAIEDWGLGFHLGNVVKYVARAGKKDASKEVEDLEKASWYLKRKIEILKAKAENRETVRPNDMNPKSTSATPASSSNASAPISGFAPNAKKIKTRYIEGRYHTGYWRHVNHMGKSMGVFVPNEYPYGLVEEGQPMTGIFEFPDDEA